MLYENYQKRISKIADTLALILKQMPKILISLAVLAAVVTVLLAYKGTFLGETEAQKELVYGEEFSYRSKAFLSKVHYEYRKQDGTEWSEKYPKLPGNYVVRARARAAFGKMSYGNEIAFSILPRSTDIWVSSAQMMWGETPTISADLAKGDYFSVRAVQYENMLAETTKVIPALSTIRVLDADGDDVTGAYVFRVVESTITFLPRPITVTVADAEREYNGLRFSFDQYELSGGTLGQGERLVAVFNRSLTEVGSVVNTPVLTVLNENGVDVTMHYTITQEIGTLTVAQRPLLVKTGGLEITYDGQDHVVRDFSIDPSTTLVKGHSITTNWRVYNDCGTYENIPDFTIHNRQGEAKTQNYAVFFESGKVVIHQKDLTVITGSMEWYYDGNSHEYREGCTVEGLLLGHTVAYTDFCKFANAATLINNCTIRITTNRSGILRDVTKNYNITNNFGTLTIHKRPVTVQSGDSSWIYDGEEHTQKAFSVVGGMGFVLNHTIVVNESASIVDVGTCKNTIQYSVINCEPTNYEITVVEGTLQITPRPVTLRPIDLEKIYDGTVLEVLYDPDNTTSVDRSAVGPASSSPYPLVKRHYFAGTVNGSQLDVGSCELVISNVKILSEDGQNVTHNYECSLESGKATVYPRPITIQTATRFKIYDGIAFHSVHEWGVSRSSPYSLAYNETISHFLVEELSITEVGSIQPKVLELVITHGRSGKETTKNYEITYELGFLTIEPRPILIMTFGNSKIYDGTPLKVGKPMCISGFVELEGDGNGRYDESLALEYYELLKTHQMTADAFGEITDAGTLIPEITNVRIVDENGVSVIHNYDVTIQGGALTVEPRPISVSTPSAEKLYDGTPLYAGKVFLIDNAPSSLLKGHVLLPEVLASITDAGKYQISGKDLQILDASKRDVTQNYAVKVDGGLLTVNPRNLVITNKYYDLNKIYDGKPLRYEGDAFLASDSQHELLQGHILNTEFEGLTDVGTLDPIILKIVILSQDGTDVTGNYHIEQRPYGRLQVLKRQVRLVPEDREKVYDGEPLYSERIVVSATSPFDLVKGHYAEGTFSYDVNNMGSGYSYITDVRIFSEDGYIDVTENYTILTDTGKLTVNYRPIILTARSVSKIYDGTPLGDSEIVISEHSLYGLLEGHYATAWVSGSITDVGVISPKLQSVMILDQNGRDMTHYYRVSTDNSGTWEIKPRPIVIHTHPDSKEYDGLPLTNSSYYVTLADGVDYGVSDADMISPPLIGNHQVSARVIGSQTACGASPNICDEAFTRVYSANGQKDVTSNYEISYDYGTLTVHALAYISITTGSAKKIYDGMPLTNGEYQMNVVSGRLLPVHTVKVTVIGSITEIGKVKNLAICSIVDRLGNDVSEYYLIDSQFGTLTVEAPSSPDIPDDPTVFGYVRTDEDTVLYLKQQSMGNYNGQDWDLAPAFPVPLDGKLYGASYLPSYALQAMEAQTHKAEFRESTLYMLPYYLGFEGDYDIPKNDTVYTSDKSEYTVTYYTMPPDVTSIEALQGNFDLTVNIYEQIYREFVKETYLWVDDETFVFMTDVIAQQGFSKKDPDVIQKVAAYIQHAAEYNLEYDPNMDRAHNVVIAFLRDYKEGICVHYATAATLLYRSLGIPARYVEGFAVQTVAGEYVEIKNPGHAWVEVYIDGVGWIPVEVTGGDGAGGSGAGNGMGVGGIGGSGQSGTKDTVRVSPVYEYKVYDGTPLVASGKLQIDPTLEALLAQGYSYDVKITGSQTRVGCGKSTVEWFAIYDPNGKNVTALFDVQIEDGVLEIFRSDLNVIKIYLYQLQKYYDGKALSFAEDDYEIIQMEEGLTLELSLNISMTNVGVLTLSDINANREKYVSYKVYKDGVDVTEDYSLLFDVFDFTQEDYVPMRIDPRVIELTAATASKLYDGKPLKNSAVSITKGTLVSGHTLQASASGSITNVGTEENVIEEDTVRITDAHGNDVTKNYQIICRNGTLTVVESDD